MCRGWSERVHRYVGLARHPPPASSELIVYKYQFLVEWRVAAG